MVGYRSRKRLMIVNKERESVWYYSWKGRWRGGGVRRGGGGGGIGIKNDEEE